MIPALIIDDEASNRRVLRILLQKHCERIQVVGEAAGVSDAYTLIRELSPRLIFLDINMPRKGGFDLLRMFDQINFEVIFVTAHDNFAIRAFEFNAVGYILKPIEGEKLKSAVDKAMERIQANNNEPVVHFVKTLSEQNDLINKISVHHNGKVIFVNLNEIACIEANGSATRIALSTGISYYSSKDLSKFEDVLEGSDNYIRINKSVIINTDYMKGYSKGETCIVDMKSGASYEVSRRRKTEILKRLKTL